MADDSTNDGRRDDDALSPEPAGDDEIERTRKLILERRNRFIAAALAGFGMTGNACTTASVCLDVPFEGADAGGAGGGGASAGGAGGGGTGGNQPCRRPNQQPPCVCLSGSGAFGMGGEGGTNFEPDDAGSDDDAGMRDE